jgi:hypothetical protein
VDEFVSGAVEVMQKGNNCIVSKSKL